jgi:hypothetical protein
VNLNESNLTVPDEDGAVERKAAAPLGTEFAPTEEFAGHDPLAGAVVGKRLNGGFILISAVILSAVAGLFSMRKLAELTAATDINEQVEETIEGFLDKLAGTGSDPSGAQDPTRSAHEQHVMAVITESYADRQVPLEDVKRDPFRLDGDTKPDIVVEEEDPEKAKEDRQAAERQRIIKAAEALALKSIVGGSTKMALIGGSIVRVGETVSNTAGNITFRVTDVTTSSVDLVAENTELELTVNVTIYLDR